MIHNLHPHPACWGEGEIWGEGQVAAYTIYREIWGEGQMAAYTIYREIWGEEQVAAYTIHKEIWGEGVKKSPDRWLPTPLPLSTNLEILLWLAWERDL